MVPVSILVLFFASAGLSFVFPIIKEKLLKQVSFKFKLSDAKKFVFFALPYLALFVFQQFFFQHGLINAGWFLAGSLLPFIIKRVNLPARLNGILLLILAVACTRAVTASILPGFLLGSILGLVVWKTVDNLFFDNSFTLEDVLPPLIWLAGDYWVTTSGGSYPVPQSEGLLLASLSVCLLLRLFQGPFMFDDKIYLKRIMLSLSGGLLMLIITTKLLLSVNLTLPAVLIGAGVFMTYLFEAMEQGQKSQELLTTTQCVALLIITGIFTLLVSRLLGMLGLLILAPTTLVALRPRATMFAGLFWTMRVLLQSYIQQYNPNVTGVNLLHSYVSAALYAGFLLVLLVAIFINQTRQKWLSTMIFLSAGILIPICSNYFLHEEPSGALLITTLAGSFIILMLLPLLFKHSSDTAGSVLLLPAQMICICLLSSDLINVGNVATIATRLTILAYLTAGLLIVSSIIWKFSAKRNIIEVS